MLRYIEVTLSPNRLCEQLIASRLEELYPAAVIVIMKGEATIVSAYAGASIDHDSSAVLQELCTLWLGEHQDGDPCV